MIYLAATRYANQPLLVYVNSYKIVTAPVLTKKWKKAVACAGLLTSDFTLHAIRETAATMAANLGASERQNR